MTAPNEKRRPGEGGALKITGQVIDPDRSTQVVADAPTCPLACSPSCAYACPVLLADSVAALLDELAVKR